jgi:trehalose-6-phosphate synthase
LLFEESNPPLEKRLALWSQTDIILCSSLKDGLCIQVLEYVVCRNYANKQKESIMICSEFAGCNEAMRGVLLYNPFSLSSFVETMDMAMSLTESDKKTRMDLAYGNITRYSFSRWTEDFLKDLKAAYKPVKASYYLGIDFGNLRSKKK